MRRRLWNLPDFPSAIVNSLKAGNRTISCNPKTVCGGIDADGGGAKNRFSVADVDFGRSGGVVGVGIDPAFGSVTVDDVGSVVVVRNLVVVEKLEYESDVDAICGAPAGVTGGVGVSFSVGVIAGIPAGAGAGIYFCDGG